MTDNLASPVGHLTRLTAIIPYLEIRDHGHNRGMSFDAMLTTGVDIIEIDRIQTVLERWGQRFLHRIYTEGEISYCRGRAPNLAARFAAKEATMKALGTGTKGVGWREIEVVRKESGAPAICLYGRAQLRAKKMGVMELALSLSHSRDYAVAFVTGVVQDSREVGPEAGP